MTDQELDQIKQVVLSKLNAGGKIINVTSPLGEQFAVIVTFETVIKSADVISQDVLQAIVQSEASTKPEAKPEAKPKRSRKAKTKPNADEPKVTKVDPKDVEVL